MADSVRDGVSGRHISQEGGHVGRAHAVAPNHDAANVTPVTRERVAAAEGMITEDDAGSSFARRKTHKDVALEETFVQAFVKNSLFPRMKFITKKPGEPDPLEFSLDRLSICHQCLMECDMLDAQDGRCAFWEKARPLVDTEIRKRRNSVQSDMKQEWEGEFVTLLVC